jgi:hypothetical protein
MRLAGYLVSSYLGFCNAMESPQNEHLRNPDVLATVGGRDPLPLCVRRVHQSEKELASLSDHFDRAVLRKGTLSINR